MKPYRFALAIATVLIMSEISYGQTPFALFAGYNSPNEINGGIQSAGKSNVYCAVELTYRFALTERAHYYFGPLPFPSPFLGISTSGIGIRTSLVLPIRRTTPRLGYLLIGLQYQDLKTASIVKDDGYYGGSNSVPYSVFKDFYNSIGIRISHVLPIRRSERLCFVYSVGINVKHVSRHYSIEGTYRSRTPSHREENFQAIAPELSAGLRYYFGRPSMFQ